MKLQSGGTVRSGDAAKARVAAQGGRMAQPLSAAQEAWGATGPCHQRERERRTAAYRAADAGSGSFAALHGTKCRGQFRLTRGPEATTPHRRVRVECLALRSLPRGLRPHGAAAAGTARGALVYTQGLR